jgi:hypothetical protein
VAEIRNALLQSVRLTGPQPSIEDGAGQGVWHK